MKTNMLASKLQGVAIDDFPSEAVQEAKASGLVIVLGESRDMVSFYGALEGEADLLEDGCIYFDKEGILPDVDDVELCEINDYYDRKKFALRIDAYIDANGFKWSFETPIPHSRFVASNGETARYCRGIVFDLKALIGKKEAA